MPLRPAHGQRIRAIVFDLGNVLVGLESWKMVRSLARKSRRGPLGVLAAYLSRGQGRAYETGRISSQTFYRRMQRRIGFRGAYRTFARTWNRMFVKRPAVEALLQKLSKRYRIVFLSDTNPLHYRFVRKRFPALTRAHAWVLSYRVGCLKPDARMFARALKKAGTAAHETFFVDDKSVNVRMARRLGFHAVRYRSLMQLKRALRREGVTW